MSQTVNLGTKYQKQIQQQFTIASILQGRLSNDLDFVGARSVRIHTIGTVPVNDYDRSASGNRYGSPQEFGDTLQELTMMQDKSFTGIVDKGNNMDQAINKAGKAMRVQLDEELVPLKDRYGFGVLGRKAGNIVGGAAVTKDNVIARLSAGRALMANKRVPLAGRTLFVRTDFYNAMVDTQQFISLDKLGNEAIVNGQIGKIMRSPVVEVPEDLLPPGVNFIWLHKAAASSPAKIADTKVHIDPPGISGNLLEGRFYWDTFVFGAKANGIYVDVTAGGDIRVRAAPAINAGTGAITGAAGAVIYCTIDGTDPRYSTTAAIYSGALGSVPAGTVIRAYQTKDTDPKTYPSPVAESVKT